MKYTVTESQYNLILESKKYIQLFQEIIDRKMDYIRKVCDMGAEEYEGDVGDESCRQVDQVENVKVIDADWIFVKHSNRPQEEKYMSVKVMVYYISNSQHGNFDADDLIYDLEQMIRKSTAMPFLLNYESTNTNKHFDW
jgi:predicted DNA-binding ArsR family transcriptional regulator